MNDELEKTEITEETEIVETVETVETENESEVKEETTKKTEKKKKEKPKYMFQRWYVRVLAVLFLIVMIFNFNHTLVLISGESMEPNYSDGNIVLADRHFELSRWDVVCISAKKLEDKILIKRVIGLPNETIEFRNNQLWVNGEYVDDIYGVGDTEDFTVTLGENEYFVMGDNREHSYDSRKYGSFTKKDIFAKVKGKRHNIRR